MDIEVEVPDIGDFDLVDVIDVLVKPGDLIKPEDPLVTLESEKATMDIPAPQGGRVVAVHVKVGDKVSKGKVILSLASEASETPAPQEAAAAAPAVAAPALQTKASTAAPQRAPDSGADESVPTTPPTAAQKYDFTSPDPGPRVETPPAASQLLLHSGGRIYASPALRKFARELGVDLTVVKGSGRKGRVMREDVAAYVKQALSSKPAPATGGFTMTAAPVVDFSKFGAIETRPLSKIKRLTGQHLHRAWVTIPHVTQFDEADITELEAFRRSKLEEAEQQGTKLTLLAFLLKAVTVLLHKYPDFNASLASDGESLIYKKYCHVGLAVNTERGLLVPVLRDTDKKGLYELASEIRALSLKARDGKLMPADMQGGCFTVSSLGGISGTGFTPIINPPEVAILGVSPSAMKPVYQNETFVPRLMLPYALSYDHRVIDGVAGADFTRHLNVVLRDIRQLLL